MWHGLVKTCLLVTPYMPYRILHAYKCADRIAVSIQRSGLWTPLSFSAAAGVSLLRLQGSLPYTQQHEEEDNQDKMASIETLSALQFHTEKLRNICILAHVDHGTVAACGLSPPLFRCCVQLQTLTMRGRCGGQAKPRWRTRCSHRTDSSPPSKRAKCGTWTRWPRSRSGRSPSNRAASVCTTTTCPRALLVRPILSAAVVGCARVCLGGRCTGADRGCWYGGGVEVFRSGPASDQPHRLARTRRL